MADLTDLARAATETADRAVPPAFESLVARARARRRRRVVTTGAAAALVLAGTAAVLVPRDGTSTTPPVVERPTPSAVASPGTPQQRLAAMTADQVIATGRLYSYGSGGGGEVLTVWQACVQNSLHCRYAWRLADRSGETAHGPAGSGDGGAGPTVHPGGGGYVVKAWNRSGILVGPDGSTTALHPGPGHPVDQQTLVVRAGARGWQAVDASSGETWPLPQPPGAEAVVDAAVGADGSVWVLPAFAGPGRVEVNRLSGDAWQSRRVDDRSSAAEVPADLAVSGTRTGDTSVAVLSSYDGATVSPAGVLAVTTDSGTTWRDLDNRALPFSTVDSMAATTAGVLFVADAEGTLWRSTDAQWTTFRKLLGVGHVYGLEPAGEQVLARTATQRPGLVLTDGSGPTEQVVVR